MGYLINETGAAKYTSHWAYISPFYLIVIKYCSEIFPVKDLSLDHVVPKSRGGKLAWTNTVTCCLACNFRKGQTPPEDLPSIGMRLRMVPRAPTNNELQYKAKNFKKAFLHPHWTIYV